jgi:hypothetical protein
MSWCWWCCHDFDTEPLMLPVKHDEKRNKFTTAGRYCSWSCMKAYAIDGYGLSRGGLICGNMVMMRKSMYGKRTPIKCAPKRQMLKEFGGAMSIEEFRENLLIDKEQPKKVVTEDVVDIVIPVNKNTAKMYEIKGAVGVNEPLRLKRAKPLKRDQNNLESVLGLVIKPKTGDN